MFLYDFCTASRFAIGYVSKTMGMQYIFQGEYVNQVIIYKQDPGVIYIVF